MPIQSYIVWSLTVAYCGYIFWRYRKFKRMVGELYRDIDEIKKDIDELIDMLDKQVGIIKATEENVDHNNCTRQLFLCTRYQLKLLKKKCKP
jgi:hypothetical protein